MSDLSFLDAFYRFCSSRWHGQLVITACALVFVILSCVLVSIGLDMSQDPETGAFILNAAWIGTWFLVGGSVLLIYTLGTFVILVAALRRYWTHRSDYRLITIGSYMTLFMLPAGTIVSLMMFYRLDVERQSLGDSTN